jgi:chitinase
MTYDLHGSWETFTGHHTALYSRSDENDLQQTLNVDFAIKYWINNGAPKHKINIGLATYGRSFTLTSSSTGLGAPAKGAGPAGKYTREAGFLAYYEVCQKLQSGYTRVWNSEQMVPYIFSGTEWIGYEDTQSLTEKVNYAINLGLGGIMFWAIDLDDFRGSFCNQGTYPLIKQAKALFDGSPIPSPSTPVTTALTLQPQSSTQSFLTTTSPNQGFYFILLIIYNFL